MNEVINYVPEQSLRRRRIFGKVCFFAVALPICGFCLYAFASGQIQAFRLASQPQPVVSQPIQHRPQPKSIILVEKHQLAAPATIQPQRPALQQPSATPKVANDASRRQLRQGFKVGYAVARLEQAMEGNKPSK